MCGLTTSITTSITDVVNGADASARRLTTVTAVAVAVAASRPPPLLASPPLLVRDGVMIQSNDTEQQGVLLETDNAVGVSASVHG